MKKNCKQILTIRNVINSLADIMAKYPSLTLDSEVIIADSTNMQEFENIRIYPIKDMYYGEDKLGIYVQPKKEKISCTYEEQKKRIKQEMKESQNEELPSKNNWWDKYK